MRGFQGISKRTVESCRRVDLAELRRLYKRDFRRGGSIRGVLFWTDDSNLEFTLELDALPHMELRYAYSIGGQRYPARVRVDLTVTYPPYGGRRYWFKCPHCGRGARVLHMIGTSWLCRKCGDLTYMKCQERKPRLLGGASFDELFARFEAENLVERWHNRQRLTRGQRQKIADYFDVPLANIRNRWYQPATRKRRALAVGRLVRRARENARTQEQ